MSTTSQTSSGGGEGDDGEGEEEEEEDDFSFEEKYSADALLQCWGVGPKKVERFGGFAYQLMREIDRVDVRALLVQSQDRVDTNTKFEQND